MKTLGPGRAVYITDYSAESAKLLRDLTTPLRHLRLSQQLAVLCVRRGWLHGSHLQVLARGYAGEHTEQIAEALAEFGEQARHIATTGSRATVQAPPEASYLGRAEQLARWENIDPPYLPLYPQGTVRIEPVGLPEGFSAALVQARDQITSRYLDLVLRTAAVEASDRPVVLMRVLAALARTHPHGIGNGTLPYRSHVEGVASATGGHADVRSTYAARFEADHDSFRTALLDPITDPLIVGWRAAFLYAWGLAEGIVASGSVDDEGLASAAGRRPVTPMGPLARSEFFAEMIATGLVQDPPYQHVAYRIILNTLYSTLSCFGISPLQRYYLCYGLAEATDRHLGEDPNARIRRIAATRTRLSVPVPTPLDPLPATA
jgi:hypothetical protein